MEYINVEKQIRESNSKLLKRLPHFVVRWISILVRQDEINRVIDKYSDYVGPEFPQKVIEELNINAEIEGLENLPESGRCFFVANHPFGFVDGMILTSTIANKYGDFKAIGNELFQLVPQLRPVVAAVNVFGASPREYILELEKVFASDVPITHFPAGMVSRIMNRRVYDYVWQKSVITKAISNKRDIVPFHFCGRNSILFYSIYLFRKAIGVKANLELSLLPHEIFNKRNKTIKVIIGKPISYKTFDDSKSHAEWAEYVKKQVYSL